MRFCGETGLRLVLPPQYLCTDNGAMIAWAGLERLSLGLVDDMTLRQGPGGRLMPTPRPRTTGRRE